MTSLALLLALWAIGTAQSSVPRRSEFGQYSGYSAPVYKDWQRTSHFIVTRDGTRLAADIYRPLLNGQPVTTPLPVVWTHDRYGRARMFQGKLFAKPDQIPWLRALLAHGYVVAAVDVRGGGASFGTQPTLFPEKETQDAYDVTEWLAAQPWCNQKIGMYGASYLGITQYLAASQSPPHLRAIMPEKAMFDLYSFVYPGGVFRADFALNWNRLTQMFDLKLPALPVDDDADGALLKAAVDEHKGNADLYEQFRALPYRDSVDPGLKQSPYLTRSPSRLSKEISRSKVAVYHVGGWLDVWTRDTLLWFKNLSNPQRLMLGPWSHQQMDWALEEAETLRWFDYWLKGINNGIMQEAPIHYYTLGAAKGQEWRATNTWSLPNEKPTRFYLRAEHSQTVKSSNDGTLSTQAPSDNAGRDDYTVDYRTSSGKPSRWSNAYGAGGDQFSYPDLTANDQLGLTYTTEALPVDTEVTGHPVLHLWVDSTAQDGDFFAYLEEIDNAGASHYVTEGTLRASHRTLAPSPYQDLGLPYHPSRAADLAGLTGNPVELTFDLYPTSNIFHKGHRIRLTITCADKGNALTPELSPAPRVSLYRERTHTSYLLLPLIPSARRR